MNWRKDSLKTILRVHADNPIKVKDNLDLWLIKFEADGNADGVAFVKVAKKLCEQLEEKRLRERIKNISDFGGTIEDAKKIELAYAMHAAGEITEDECVKMVVDTTTLEQITAFAAKYDTPYKYGDSELKSICTLLKKEKYINSADNFFFALKGRQQARKVWLKPITILIYLIRQIREDGKCNYAEASKIFCEKIKANNAKGSYKEIDEIIKVATTS